VIRSRELETGLELLSFTIAGIVALCGVNSAGVAVWCNAVYQLASSLNGVPVVCVARSALSQWTLEAAEQLIRTVPHASGQNYLVGGPSGIHALECSARLVVEARPDGNSVWHTNHPLASEDLVSSSSDESSLARDAFTGAQLRRSTRVESLQRILADRTVPAARSVEIAMSSATHCGRLSWSTSSRLRYTPVRDRLHSSLGRGFRLAPRPLALYVPRVRQGTIARPAIPDASRSRSCRGALFLAVALQTVAEIPGALARSPTSRWSRCPPDGVRAGVPRCLCTPYFVASRCSGISSSCRQVQRAAPRCRRLIKTLSPEVMSGARRRGRASYVLGREQSEANEGARKVARHARRV
jgi:Acyl-coenzyme A:6-aminopenicillanic acid acyl-transferase